MKERICICHEHKPACDCGTIHDMIMSDIARSEFKLCNECAWQPTCKATGSCIMEEVDHRHGSDPFAMLGWIIGVIITCAVILIAVIFLSSRPAGASHGPTGYVISDCCSGVNRASGTSYRVVALAFQPYRYTSVFETGTQDIEYILQWPQLPSVAEQAIRMARQRLSIVMAASAVERSQARLDIDWKHTQKALGMACLFGGLMIFISFWGYRKR